MPNTNTPRGFLPVSSLDGRPISGATRVYRIAANYNTAIYSGDPVIFLSTGFINVSAGNDQFRGVFAGCRWVRADGTVQFSTFWPGAQTTLGSQPAEAFVHDDPDIVYEAQFTNSTTAPTLAALGATFNTTMGTGSTFTGQSGAGLDFTSLGTSAQQWRVLDYVPRADNDTVAAYARVLCVPALHDFRVNTGI